MSGISTMTLKTGATYAAPTGGSNYVFAPDGITIQNGIHLTVPGVASYTARPTATAKYRAAQLSASGKFSKYKNMLSISVPKILADGTLIYRVLRVEIEDHPEATAAENADLRLLGSQALCGTDSQNFFVAGGFT